MHRYSLAAVICGGLLFAAAPAEAQALSGPCPVGKMVQNREGKVGKVLDTDAVSCHVLIDGEKKYYLSWMLRLPGAPEYAAADVARIPPKKYACYGNGNYLFMDLIIKDASNYTDGSGKAGKFSYDAKTRMINFQSGPFKGSYSQFRGKDGIGLASKPTTFWATVCQ